MIPGLDTYSQWILWRAIPSTREPGKVDKVPHDYRTGRKADPTDPKVWTDVATAKRTAQLYGDSYGAGFVFSESDPFFFLDIDNALSDGLWSTTAQDLLARFPGAAVEISQSGTGLHIFGSYAARPEHGCVGRCPTTAHKLELYTSGRFAAITGVGVTGSALTDCTAPLASVSAAYFPPKTRRDGAGWTTEPVEGYVSTLSDEALIAKALASVSVKSALGGGASFADLWRGDTSAYSDDASSADMALATHLAFWTGGNCERVLALMKLSGLSRPKWDRDDYMRLTVENAVAGQDSFFSVVVEPAGVAQLTGTKKQREGAAGIRAQKLAERTIPAPPELLAVSSSRYWLDNKNTPADSIQAPQAPPPPAPREHVSAGKIVSGIQYLPAPQQLQHFSGCVYVQDQHRVLTPSGSLLKADQFNAMYGGYTFQLDDEKSTRKAWEAFTESQVARFPKVDSTTFRPDMPAGAIITEDKKRLVNSYVPIDTRRVQGDVSRFLELMAKVIPDKRDRRILLSYMAACVQYKGVKFQWAPLLQGVEGNGKTLFTRAVIHAVGRKYAHMPPASELSEKFNSWLFSTVFIGIDDIKIADHRVELLEILKPMITSDWQSARLMNTEREMRDVCCNFIFNSNHKDAIRKTRNDRRFCVFYTAQQSKTDLERDGMDGDYFPRLYDWLLKEDGFAIVNDFLQTYEVEAEFNPATTCQIAPVTSTTAEALTASLGSAEQAILESVAEARVGFSGGWVSSVAVENLLREMRLARAIPPNKRREMMRDLGYDWHPALRDGRSNNPIGIDEGKKPRLFIKEGHISAQLKSPRDAVKAYINAQTPRDNSVAEALGRGAL